MKPDYARIAGLAPAALAVMMLAYRIYLAIVTVEYAVAKAAGDAGSLHLMNALGISLWVMVSAFASWLGIRVWHRRTSMHVTPIQ